MSFIKRIRSLLRRSPESSEVHIPDPLAGIRILVVTIKEVEYHAVVETFFGGHFEAVSGEKLDYSVGYIECRNTDSDLVGVAVHHTGMPGHVGASSVVFRAINDLPDLELVVMCGIAGGSPDPSDPETNVRLGDIAIGTLPPKNVSAGKQTQTEFKHVDQALNPPDRDCCRIASRLVVEAEQDSQVDPEWENVRKNAVAKLRERNIPTPLRKFDWDLPSSEDVRFRYDDDGKPIEQIPHPKDEWREAYPTRPRVFLGLILSGDYVQKSDQQRDEKSSHPEFSKAIAYEMESFGIASAATVNEIPYFVVRGIVDYQDPGKNDAWHPTGALRAASMAKCILQNRNFLSAAQSISADRIFREKGQKDRLTHPSISQSSQPAAYAQASTRTADTDSVRTLVINLQDYLDQQDGVAVITIVSQLEAMLDAGSLDNQLTREAALACISALIVSRENGYIADGADLDARLSRLFEVCERLSTSSTQ